VNAIIQIIYAPPRLYGYVENIIILFTGKYQESAVFAENRIMQKDFAESIIEQIMWLKILNYGLGLLRGI